MIGASGTPSPFALALVRSLPRVSSGCSGRPSRAIRSATAPTRRAAGLTATSGRLTAGRGRDRRERDGEHWCIGPRPSRSAYWCEEPCPDARRALALLDRLDARYPTGDSA